MSIPLLLTEESELVIMIVVVTEEMHGSDRDADLKLKRALVGMAIFSNRAKWRSSLSECRGVQKKYLTTPAL
jgi:hypothetical protein